MLKPYKPYFLIKVPKQTQSERRQKIGSLFIPPNFVWMRRNLQMGEIVGIGEGAAKYFPEAQIGHIAIVHHFIEGQAYNNESTNYLVDTDDTHNYYVVTAYDYEGRRNETYGVWDGTTIIPNKDFVFLEVETEETTDVPELVIESNMAGESSIIPNIPMMVSESGLIIPKPKKKTREELTLEMGANTERIKQLSNIRRMSADVEKEILRLEKENNQLSRLINKQEYLPFKIAFANPSFDATSGDTVYSLNIASHTKVEFMSKEYILTNVSYIAVRESI
jgi:hypothetical protein